MALSQDKGDVRKEKILHDCAAGPEKGFTLFRYSYCKEVSVQAMHKVCRIDTITPGTATLSTTLAQPMYSEDRCSCLRFAAAGGHALQQCHMCHGSLVQPDSLHQAQLASS